MPWPVAIPNSLHHVNRISRYQEKIHKTTHAEMCMCQAQQSWQGTKLTPSLDHNMFGNQFSPRFRSHTSSIILILRFTITQRTTHQYSEKEWNILLNKR